MVLFRFFFGLNFDKKFQPFKNHVNNEVLGGPELPDNTLKACNALQMSHPAYEKAPFDLSELGMVEL